MAETTEGLIIKAYLAVVGGLKRVDLESEEVSIKAYKAGTIIRIDVKAE